MQLARVHVGADGVGGAGARRVGAPRRQVGDEDLGPAAPAGHPVEGALRDPGADPLREELDLGRLGPSKLRELDRAIRFALEIRW